MDSRRATALLLTLIVFVALGARAFGVSGDLDDHDTWRQTDTATIARNFVDEPDILLPRVNWGAPGPGYVEAEFQLYTFATSLLYRAFGADAIWGRLLSIALCGLSILVFRRIAGRFLDPPWALTAAALFAFAPVVFRFTRTFMPESLALLCLLVAIEWFLAFLDDRSWGSLAISGVAMATAILVKPTTIHLGLTFAILSVLRYGWRTLFDRQHLAYAAATLLPAVAYYAHAASVHAQYGNTFGVISGGDSKWGNLDWWLNPTFYYRLAFMDCVWILGPVGAVAVLWAFVSRKTRPELRVLGWAWLPSLAIYYLAAARYTGFEPRGLHYHVYAAPFHALLACATLSRIRARWITVGAIGLTLAWQFALDARVLLYHRPALREAGLALERVSEPDDVVVVLSQDPRWDGRGVRNNFEQPDVFFHAWRRGRVLALDEQTTGDLRRVLGDDARWFVNYPELNDADSEFVAELRERHSLRTRSDTYEIWEVSR